MVYSDAMLLEMLKANSNISVNSNNRSMELPSIPEIESYNLYSLPMGHEAITQSVIDAHCTPVFIGTSVTMLEVVTHLLDKLYLDQLYVEDPEHYNELIKLLEENGIDISKLDLDAEISSYDNSESDELIASLNVDAAIND